MHRRLTANKVRGRTGRKIKWTLNSTTVTNVYITALTRRVSITKCKISSKTFVRTTLDKEKRMHTL